MYNSIQQFNEFGFKKIAKTIETFLAEKKDISDLAIGLEESLYELGRNILEEVLEEMDEGIFESKERKKRYEAVRKNDKNSLLTRFGTIRYRRRYYKSKESEKYTHLVDERVGIQPHDRVSADVVIKALDEATQSSYSKAGTNVAYDNDLTKQAVMNKVHEIEVVDAPLPTSEKRTVRVLHIEADEDHVALQKKPRGGDEKRKPRISCCILLYIEDDHPLFIYLSRNYILTGFHLLFYYSSRLSL